MGIKGKTVLVGVSGGIAAYKAADLVSKLRQLGAEVTLIAGPTHLPTPIGAERFSRIRGYISTLRKQGLPIFPALRGRWPVHRQCQLPHSTTVLSSYRCRLSAA